MSNPTSKAKVVKAIEDVIIKIEEEDTSIEEFHPEYIQGIYQALKWILGDEENPLES